MNRPSKEDGHVRMPEEEFEGLLELAAERGAKRALADVGLGDEQAADDVRDYAKPTVMRSWRSPMRGSAVFFGLCFA